MPDDRLRAHLIALLLEGQAHITLADALKAFPITKAGIRPPGAAHSAWELLEHIRIAQADIVRFSGAMGLAGGRPKGYVELAWPDDYWPSSPAPKNASEWKKSVDAIKEDLSKFVRLLKSPKRDLLEPFPWGDGQTLLREALLIADHNSYHAGQLMMLRRMIE